MRANSHFTDRTLQFISVDQHCSENAKEEVRQSNNRVLVNSLLLLSDFLKKGKLEQLNNIKFQRYQSEAKIVFTHQLSNLYRYDLPFISGEKVRTSSKYRAKQVNLLIHQLIRLAKELTCRFALEKIKKNVPFTTKRENTLLQEWQLRFSPEVVSNLINRLSIVERAFSLESEVGSAKQAIRGIDNLIELGSSLYELDSLGPLKEFVEGKLQEDLTFFIRGYPSDILVHDKRALKRKDSNVTSIYCKRDICSTICITDNTEQILDANYVHLKIKKRIVGQ